MICPQCYTFNEEDARFCKGCGRLMSAPVLKRPLLERKHKLVLLIYLGFQVFTRLVYAVLTRIVPLEFFRNNPEGLGRFFKTTDLALSAIDVLALAMMVVIFEGRMRTICILLILARFIIFIAYFFF